MKPLRTVHEEFDALLGSGVGINLPIGLAAMIAIESAVSVIVVTAGNIAADTIIAVAGLAAVNAVAKSLRPTEKKSETCVPLWSQFGLNSVPVLAQYFGTFGSTSFDQAVIPPRRFFIGPA